MIQTELSYSNVKIFVVIYDFMLCVHYKFLSQKPFPVWYEKYHKVFVYVV